MRPFPRTISAVIGGIIVAIGIGYSLLPEKPIRAVTQVYPPYQYLDEHQKIVGTSIDTMDCALRSVGHNYTVDIVRGQGWADAQFKAEQGEYDLVYGALHTQGRDRWGIWSAALDINKTYYARLKDNPIDRHDVKARWGVKKGSGIASQLEGTPRTVTFLGEDNPEVVEAMLVERPLIDFVYMDIEIFKWSVRSNGVRDKALEAVVGSPDEPFETDLFYMEPVADQLYGAYFTRHWLASHPGFMDRINAAIGDCRQKRELMG